MTRILYPFFSFFMIFLVSIPCSSKNRSTGKDDPIQESHYDLSIIDHDYALVSYTFEATDSLLQMSSRGADQFEKRWATFVSDLTAVSESGQNIAINHLPQGQWTYDAEKGTVIKLTYRVNLDHEKHEWSGGIDGVAYKRDHGVFYSGRSLFITSGTGRQSITVNFKVPNHWKISTVWDSHENGKDSYKLGNYQELSESMIFVGEHEQFRFKREGFELLLALGGEEIIAKKQEYENLARGVLDYYIDLMGGVPNPSPENPFHRALVIINPSEQPDGEVIGNSISILESNQPDPMTQMISRFVCAHELFHLWNGKSFFPSDQRCEWFKEGVTNYYTLKSLYHVGVLNEESFFAMLNGFFYKRYTSDPGVGSLSMTQGEEKHDHWGLVYSGGLFAGISQDIIIRKATNNERSLDDLMKGLFSDLGGTNDSYSLEDLQNNLEHLSGTEQAAFFEKYIVGSRKIPLDKYLMNSGLYAKIEDDDLNVSRRKEESAEEDKIIRGLLGEN